MVREHDRGIVPTVFLVSKSLYVGCFLWFLLSAKVILYGLEKHLLFAIAVYSLSKYYLNETRNKTCTKSSRYRASRLEILAVFAKKK